MSEIILKIENVSKQYQLGQFGTGSIGRDVDRWWRTKVLNQEDPYLKIGAVNDRTSKEKANFVWALKDINFEVKRGEVLGIIGKNGAGKSTLLKLLSRVTSPTTGTIKCAGRMASLLEVGTGFHPELSGRENIFLNGAILGMTKKEIQSKFDEIVDFSGCELYIDTPTKRYSSGMTVRLGFAVAAFLDPEILIVDEVLAVGDAEFQKKAIGKMQDVSKGEGRTVLFVSHNMGTIKQLCQRILTLQNGTVRFEGDVITGINSYLNDGHGLAETGIIPVDMKRQYGTEKIKFTQVQVLNANELVNKDFLYKEPLKIRGIFRVYEDFRDGYNIMVKVGTLDGQRIVFSELNRDKSSYNICPNILEQGNYNFSLDLNISLLPGTYSLYLGFGQLSGHTEEWVERVYDFNILRSASNIMENYRWTESHGYVLNESNFIIDKI
jgi:lipopolysaccharide transport system ATP-binding protein